MDSYVFNTISELKSFNINNLTNGNLAFVLGYYNLNDGGKSEYFWDSLNTDPNDIITIIPHSTPTQGRWKRIVKEGIIDIKSIGCKDYVLDSSFLDNSSKIQSLINKNIHAFIPTGKFRITNTLKIERNSGEPETIRRGYSIRGRDVSSSFLLLDSNVNGISVQTFECRFENFTITSRDIANSTPTNSGFILGGVDDTSIGNNHSTYDYNKNNAGYCIINNVTISGIFNKHLLKYGIIWHHGSYLTLSNVKLDYIKKIGLYCSGYNIDNNHGVLNLIANSCKKWGMFIERGAVDWEGNNIPHWNENSYPSRHHQFINLKTFDCGNNDAPNIEGDKKSGGVRIDSIDNFGHMFFENTKIPTLSNIDVSNLLFGKQAVSNFIFSNNFSDIGIRQINNSNSIVDLKDLGDILNTVVGHDNFARPKFYNLLAQNIRIRNNEAIGYTEMSAEGDLNPNNVNNKTVFKIGGNEGHPYRIKFDRGNSTSLDVNFDDNISIGNNTETKNLSILNNMFIKGLDFNISNPIYNVYSVQHEFSNVNLLAGGIFDKEVPASKFNAGSDNDISFASLINASNKPLLWSSYCVSAGGQLRIKVKNESNQQVNYQSLKFNFVIFKTGF